MNVSSYTIAGTIVVVIIVSSIILLMRLFLYVAHYGNRFYCSFSFIFLWTHWGMYYFWEYRWHLNNVGLNHMGPFVDWSFSSINTQSCLHVSHPQIQPIAGQIQDFDRWLGLRRCGGPAVYIVLHHCIWGTWALGFWCLPGLGVPGPVPLGRPRDNCR